jgi:hypothetical protein
MKVIVALVVAASQFHLAPPPQPVKVAKAPPAPVNHHYERQLAAVFRARGVENLTPSMVRDLAVAQIKTGTPAGVLASISEREFSHNTVRVPGSIEGTVSSRGYFSPFAFKPSSWDYYKTALWGPEADSHNPYDYGDAAIVAGEILQHYREPGTFGGGRMRLDPLGSLRDYNANYAAGVLSDAGSGGKYHSPLWKKLAANIKALDRGPPPPPSPEEISYYTGTEQVDAAEVRRAYEQQQLDGLKSRIRGFFLSFWPAA